MVCLTTQVEGQYFRSDKCDAAAIDANRAYSYLTIEDGEGVTRLEAGGALQPKMVGVTALDRA
jgi:hypothetical protein